MNKFTFVLLCMLPNAFLTAQLCDVKKGLSEIEIRYSQGDFETVITQGEKLEHCESISEEQYENVLIYGYKSLRNLRKGRKAFQKLDLLKSFREKNKQELSFELIFLLAEGNALRNNQEEHRRYLKIIEDSLLTIPSATPFEMGRYYLIKYYGLGTEEEAGQSLALAQKALSYFDQLEQPPTYYKGNALRGLGNMNRNRADYDKSASYYKQELALYEANYPPEHFDIAVCHFNLGNIYYFKLEYQEALDHYLKARNTWKEIYKPEERYMKMLNEAIGDMYWELENSEKALYYFDLSLAGEKKIDNDLSQNAINLADSIFQSGNYGNAISYYEKAYAWRKETFGKNHSLTGACKNFVARAVRSNGNTKEALRSYQEAISILVEGVDSEDIHANPKASSNIKSHAYLLESLIAKGELLFELYSETTDLLHLKTAMKTNELAIEVLEQLKRRHMSETSKVFWTQHTLSLIENSIATAIALHEATKNSAYLEQAFLFSEKSKALLLLAAIDDRENVEFSNVASTVLEKESLLKKEIISYRGKLESEEKRCADVRAKMVRLYTDKLRLLQNEYDLILNEIKATYPDYYDLKYETKIASISEIRSNLLDEQTQLVSYFVGVKQNFVFHLTNSDLSVRAIDNTEAFQSDLTNFFGIVRQKEEALKHPNEAYTSFTQDAHALYQILIAPELTQKKTSQLIIIPDGLLAYIPFDALLTKEAPSGRDYKNLPYLLKEYAISYVPSATIGVKSTHTPESSSAYVGFAPQYEGVEFTDSRTSLKNLEHNGKEVMFGATLFKGQGWMDGQISEENLKDNVATAGILHLAMHGQMDDEHPLLSRLYLNPSEVEDGMLHTYEIYNMRIPAQLVILSACNTATGKLERGEGILSLERAFQYAGSRALLSTLWTVDDAVSASLVANFLTEIKAGKSKDVALQEAKLLFLQNSSPDKLHPFYWASFKLTGNTEKILMKSNVKYIYLGFSLLLVVFIGGYFLRRQRAA